MSKAVPPVEIFVFRPFTVRVNGAPLTFAAKAQRKPLTLLRVLIALGGEHIPETSLTDSIWPESDGDAAHLNFKSALHRLRQLIGSESLRHRDTRLSLNREQCWMDGFELDDALRQAEDARTRSERAAEHAHVRSILAWYQAPFLDGEFDPPEILIARERWHSRVLRAIDANARALLSEGNLGEAAEVLRRGIEIDAVNEDLHRLLIGCYAAQGKPAEALDAFERCKRLLHSGAGIAPSSETEALGAAIVRGVTAGAGPGTPVAAEGTNGGRRSVAREQRRLAVLELRWNAARPGGQHEAAAAVRTHGGFLHRTGADGCLALFGWPAAHEDDPVRAVRAARATVSAAEGARAAVTCGTLLLELEGGASEGIGVTGAAVEDAARLAKRVPPVEIWVDAATVPAVAGYFRARVVKERRKAGAQSAPAFRIIAETDAESAIEASALRGFTPFTGRAAELARLDEALAEAAAGRGQFVTVAGEAGLGKSRLVHEFRRRIDKSRITVLEGRCQSHGGGTAYLPLLDALRRGLRLGKGDAPGVARTKVATNIRVMDPALERYLPLYLYLLSIPGAEHPLPANLQGDALRVAIEDALAAVVLASAARQPLVLIYEDWHWADEASESALRTLLRFVPRHPLLVVVLHRFDYAPRWGHLPNQRNLTLARLSREECASMLRFRLRAAHAAGELVDLVHERTGGNPFFIEELAQSLRAEGTVCVVDGQARLARGVDPALLPASVESVVRARMDRLDPHAQELLRWASIIGREFPRPILERVYPQSAGLAAALDRLAAEELIQPVRLLPEPEHRFKHVLAQVAVHESMPEADRRARHAAVGAAIERLHEGRLEEHYDSLAHHFALSDRTDKAIEYLEKAGDRAAAMYALQQGQAYYLAAIERIGSSERGGDWAKQLIDVVLKWAKCSHYVPAGDRVTKLEDFLARTIDALDEHRVAKMEYWIGLMKFYLGDVNESLRILSRCSDVARAVGDREFLGIADNAVGRVLLSTARYQEAAEKLRQGIAAIEKLGMDEEVSWSRGFLGLILARTGRFRDANEEAAKSLAGATRLGNRTRQALAHDYGAMVCCHQGQWSKAKELSTEGIRIAKDIGATAMAWFGTDPLAQALFMLGDHEEAVHRLSEAVQHMEDVKMLAVLANTEANRAEMLALSGDSERASQAAQRSLELKDLGHHWGEPVALRALAIVKACSAQPDGADVESAFRRARGIAETYGQLPDLAITDFRSAEARQMQGDLAGALIAATEASRRFAELEMPWWSDQARALHARLVRGEPFRGFAPFAEGAPAPK